MNIPRRILEVQDVDNRRIYAGDPNGYVYGEPGWTCQDITNGRLYVCTIAGLNGWTLVSTGAAAATLTGTYSIDFGTIAANDTHTANVTLTGAVANDVIALGRPLNYDPKLVFEAHVVSANTVQVHACNTDGTNITPGILAFKIMILR